MFFKSTVPPVKKFGTFVEVAVAEQSAVIVVVVGLTAVPLIVVFTAQTFELQVWQTVQSEVEIVLVLLVVTQVAAVGQVVVTVKVVLVHVGILSQPESTAVCRVLKKFKFMNKFESNSQNCAFSASGMLETN